jgi:glucokinase
MPSSRNSPPFYVGIDLGGTNIKSGVVDNDGRPMSSVSIETHADEGGNAGLERLVEAANKAVRASGLNWDRIAAVGLGSPGTMDLQSGMLLEPPNLPGWENFPIRRLLADRLEKPTTLQNDANAASYGEFWVGAGRDHKSQVMFTLGTGIGCGIVVDGMIIEGRHSHGAECGHIIIEMENGRLCSCGQYGHLEGYASATALVKRAQEALEYLETPSVLRDLKPDELTSRAISKAADSGDEIAHRLMRETARYLAVGAVSLMHTIDPDIVLFGGGMIAAGQRFLDDIRTEIRERAFPVPAAKTLVEFAKLGGDAGFIGAAGCSRLAFHKPAED